MWTLIVRKDGKWRATGWTSRYRELLDVLATRLHVEQWRTLPIEESANEAE